MRNFLTKAFYWRLQITKGIIGSGIVGATFVTTQLSNTNWDELNMQGKLMLFLGLFIAMGKSVEMFLDQGIAQVKKNIIAANPDTQFFMVSDGHETTQPVPDKDPNKPKD